MPYSITGTFQCKRCGLKSYVQSLSNFSTRIPGYVWGTDSFNMDTTASLQLFVAGNELDTEQHFHYCAELARRASLGLVTESVAEIEARNAEERRKANERIFGETSAQNKVPRTDDPGDDGFRELMILIFGLMVALWFFVAFLVGIALGGLLGLLVRFVVAIVKFLFGWMV